MHLILQGQCAQTGRLYRWEGEIIQEHGFSSTTDVQTREQSIFWNMSEQECEPRNVAHTLKETYQ